MRPLEERPRVAVTAAAGVVLLLAAMLLVGRASAGADDPRPSPAAAARVERQAHQLTASRSAVRELRRELVAARLTGQRWKTAALKARKRLERQTKHHRRSTRSDRERRRR